MEAPFSSHYSNARDSSSRASYTRASSRSSTGAPTSVRMTQQQERYASGLNPNGRRGSPAPSSSTENSSRFRSSMNDVSSIELSASASRPSLIATSSYLQEKLQREKDRIVESERSSSRQSDHKSVSSADSRPAHLHTPTQSISLQQQVLQQSVGSPSRPLFDISRPRSSTGHLDKSKKAGVGLKEMEQTLTNLHKQNFDLKLELYHRREKQTTLEERCESLEAEKMELEADKRNLEGEKHDLEEINDKLMSELEMRDKAVEEAVAMIVSLEARMDELLSEREMMAKQAEEQEQFFATDARLRQALSSALDHVNAQPRATTAAASTATRRTNDDHDNTLKNLKARPSASKIVDDFTHTINRMPSFVSDRSELTENLRNVYLGARVGSSITSFSHDRFQSMDGTESDIRDARVGSPALSVLSESSFLSIYGKKPLPPMSINITSAPTQRHDKRQSKVACVPDIRRNMPATTPSIDTSMTSSMDSNGSGETCVDDGLDASTGSAANVVAHALAATGQHAEVPEQRSTTPRMRTTATDFLDTNSPLQRIGQMDKSKQDKRDALRRVRTDAPFLSNTQTSQQNHSHNLPPTPDTISTSTLRRFKNSSETLNNSRCASGDQRTSAIESFVDSIPHKVPTSTSFVRYDNINKSFFGSALTIPPRPRSAGETTVSHHGRGSVWDSESSDGGEDTDVDGNDSVSVQDVQDYWLRESLRPIGQAPTTARHHRNRLSESNTSRTGGRISPDLFSFPMTANGWATTAMFGPAHDSYNRPEAHSSRNNYNYRNAPLAQTLDALGESLPAPAPGLFSAGGLLASSLPYGGPNGAAPVSPGPPPPPHRRSSLHARTSSTYGGSSRSGSRHGTAPGTPSMGTPSTSKHVRRSPGKPPQSRAGTVSSSAGKEERPRTAAPAPAGSQDLNLSKQRHYPPAASTNTASRSRVMSLFRRSGSHDVPSATTPAADAPTDSDAATTSGSFGALSRVRGDDSTEGCSNLGVSAGVGASSTPPPIMRNPRNPDRGNVDMSAQASSVDAAEPKEAVAEAVSAPSQDVTPAPAMAPGQRMKWLGRVASLRNRAG